MNWMMGEDRNEIHADRDGMHFSIRRHAPLDYSLRITGVNNGFTVDDLIAGDDFLLLMAKAEDYVYIPF